ncbi:hypothetical protein VTI28DRAFT_7173 [Corynascus sepedonium]
MPKVPCPYAQSSRYHREVQGITGEPGIMPRPETSQYNPTAPKSRNSCRCRPQTRSRNQSRDRDPKKKKEENIKEQ